jgi:hypothetical protein
MTERAGAGNKTDPDTVKGIEGIGTRQDGILGRGSESVRGNVIEGVSDSNPRAPGRLAAGAEELNGVKPSQIDELTYEDFDEKRRNH